MTTSRANTRSSNPQCGVLGCKLPRDESYREAAGGYFCWCTVHGEWYAARDVLNAEWQAKVKAAHAARGVSG